MGGSEACILGIDLGTTGCRSILFTSGLRTLGVSYYEYPLLTGERGEVEQDADQWWQLVQRTAREVVSQCDVSPANVRAISVSSQGISFVPVDQAGDPLCNALSWLDTRAAAESRVISESIGNERVRSLTGKRNNAYYVLPKLMWLRAHRPEVHRKTARYLMAHDFVLHKLCGVFATDCTMASGSLMYDLVNGRWSSELLEFTGVETDMLPHIQRAGTLVGRLREQVAGDLGLTPETMVCVGGQDQHCAALGAGMAEKEAGVSLGTACQILLQLDRPDTDPTSALPCSPSLFAGNWTLDGVLGTAGASLRWLRDTFYPGTAYAELSSLAARSGVGSGSVFYYPHLAGGGSPRWVENSTGAFVGLTLNTQAQDVVRAVFEGIAFQIHANILSADESHRPEGLCMYGGGAQSAPWCQVISDVSGLPVRVSQTHETATVGAAVLAGLGSGIYRNVDEAASLIKDDQRFEPDEKRHQHYEQVFAAYQDLELRMWPAQGDST